MGNVCERIRYNTVVPLDIPEWYITKSGQEPTKREKLHPREFLPN